MNPIHALKLGKKPAVHDPRTLKLAKYLNYPQLPTPPARVDWTSRLGPLGMMANDRLGDCTCAAMGHMVQVWTAEANEAPVVISDEDIVKAYEAACGYSPGDPSSDQGGNEQRVLSYWRNTGIGPAGHKITGFASVNPHDRLEVQTALALFGGIYLGVALPLSAQAQVGRIWSTMLGANAQPNSWGGHAVPGAQYDETGLTVITWGALQRMTWGFFQTYVDEAYAVVSEDWITRSGKAPSGFDLETLKSDLAKL